MYIHGLEIRRSAMEELTLKDMVKDVSEKEGNEPGFLFQIRCPHCKGIWESDFTPFAGKLTGVGKALGIFKKSQDSESSSEWDKAKNAALDTAVSEAEAEFVYCKYCQRYVCNSCWNTIREMCLGCCVTQAMSAYDSALKEQREQAEREQQAICSQCGFNAPGANFCPKCGGKIVVKGTCPGCAAKLPPEAVFCPQCGKKI